MVEKITLPLTPDPIRIEPYASSPLRPVTVSQPQADFAAVLRRESEIGQLRFSHHAEVRLREREIELTPAQRERIEKAVEAADRRGARESLILLDDLALVVSIRNRTVITAMDARHRKSNVFTNIDSAVLA
ncbi:MAG: TIGR02530 family flagellar biosynthesis protein [Anaerolineae bacterium]|nr:flagellar protein [Anaerolineae bacterium]MDW8099712.1 TIGR02530 family flagellar biosynthesis protein [Anaerolineae bacterium]